MITDYKVKIIYEYNGKMYIGKYKDLNIICQGSTLEILKRRMKNAIETHINFYSAVMEQDEPFEIKKVKQI